MQVDTVVFDKTGTLTLGKPQVTHVLALDPAAMPSEKVLQLAAAVEASTTHPVALAVVRASRCVCVGVCVCECYSLQLQAKRREHILLRWLL